MLTCERLKEVLHYDPDTGVFLRKISSGGKRAGDVAGGPCKIHGYHRVRVEGLLYFTHRLAWFYMTGEWPEHQIDHINGNRADSRFSNLRLATRSQNFANRAKYSNNKSGYKGAHWHKKTRKWQSAIGVGDKKPKYLGLFDTAEEASAAYEEAAAKLHGEFYYRLGISAEDS